MAKNQSTYTLKIDAELGNLQQILSQARSSLQSFMASGSAPKGLEKAFEKIRDLLGQIQDKTGKSLDLKGLTSTGKSLDSVQESFSAIIRLLGEFDDLSDGLKLSFLTEEDKKRIEAVTASLQKYQATLASISEQEKKLEAAKKTQTKDSGTVSRVSKKISDTTSKKEGLEAKRSSKQGQLDALTALGDKADPVRVAKLQGEIGQLNVEIGQLDKSLQEVNEELEAAQASFVGSSREVERLEKSIKKTSGDALKELKAEAESLGISLDGLNGRKASEQMKILTERMSKFKIEIANGAKPAFEEIRNGCKKGGEAARDMGEGIEQAIDSVEAMDEAAAQRDAFEAKIKQFLGLQGAAQLLRAALRDAISTITELDATMTQMAVVTDLSVGDYWDQLPEYSKRASELGVSINSAYEAATLYYQQGLKTNEVVAISNETLKMAKIAGLEAADATDKMTAALRGFNMELNEASAQKISDVYSELAAITAADVDEISSAMTKTASIASSAGMEFETTAAFLSQIIETTRESAETAGTAMKTVIARFQELKKDPKDIGEVDGEIVDANAIETALRSVGVSLRDASGQFRDLDDVFLELSSKWNTLDKNTQRYIATIAAGSRQQSRFIAMMSDYARTQELVTAANNSAGASQKQFEKTTESLEYKIEKLKNAWHEFTMGIMNSDLVKFGVDAITTLLEVVNKATNAFEGFGGSLTKIATILSIFKVGKTLFQKIPENFKAAMVEVIRHAIEGGEKAAEGAAEGAKRKTDEIRKAQVIKTQQREQTTDPQAKKTFGQVAKQETKQLIKQAGHGILSAVGVNNYQQAAQSRGLIQGYRDTRKHQGTYKNMRVTGLQISQRALTDKINSGTLDPKTLKQTKKELESVENQLAAMDMTAEQFAQEQKKMWNNLSQGVQKTGQAVVGTGMAFSMLGGILQSCGLEEAGQLISKIGNGLTIVGSAISALGPMVVKLVAKLVAGDMSAMAAWIWVAGIVFAIVALVAAVAGISKAIKDNSAEGQLKKMESAAEKAGDAAQQLQDSYENLSNSLDSLSDKYQVLEGLTEHTKEWNKAIIDINNSVLDLIEKYPDLAEFVYPENGALKIDIDSKEVQDVIKAAQSSALLSKNASAMANAQVSFAESRVLKERYGLKGQKIDELSTQVASGEIVIKDGAFVAGTKSIESLGYTTAQLEELYKQNSDNIMAIREYGNSLLQAQSQQKASFTSMILAAQQMANTEAFSHEVFSISSNIIQETLVSETYNKELSKIRSINYTNDNNLTEYEKQERDKAVREVYGQDVKIEDLTNEQIQTAIAQTKAVSNVVEFINDIPIMLSTFADQNSEESTKMLNNLLQDWEGGEMSMSDYNRLANMSTEELKKIYKDLGPIAKKIFGSEESFLEQIDETKKILESQNKSMKTSVEMIFGKGEKLPNWNIPPEIGNQLLIKFQEIFNKADFSTFETFYNQFDEILSKLTEDEQRTFSSIFESLDWENTADLATLPDKLHQAGVSLKDFGIDLYGFIDNVVEASNAVAKLTAEELSKVLGDVSGLIENINKGEQGRTVSEQQYNSLLVADPTLKKEFAKTSDGYLYLGNSMADLKEAVISNTKALKGEDPETANRVLDVFDAMDTIVQQHSENIDNYNTYMSYDTAIAEKNAEITERQNRINLIGNPDPNSIWTQIADAIYWASGGMSFSDSPMGVATELASEKNRLQGEISELEKDLQKDKNDQERLSDYAVYSDYKDISAETVSTLNRAQLIDFLFSLDQQADLSALNISGLTDNYDFNQLSDDILKNLVQQLFQAMGNKTYYEGLAKPSPEVDVGNKIETAILDGSAGLAQWYIDDYGKEEKGAMILKGAMIKLAENYEVPIEILSEFFDAEENVILDKFDEFITLIGEKELDERMRIPKEQTLDLMGQVKDALIEARQKEIDKLAEGLETIAEANNKMVQAIQDWVAEDRQRRQNEETEKEISNKYSQLAYLSMDTSGSQLEKLTLQEEITKMEQDYQDTLIDQSIQKLQDANQKAQEQREQQISLMQAQLDIWKNSDELWADVNAVIINASTGLSNGTDFNNTELGALLNNFNGNLSPEEKEDFVEKIIELIGGYKTYNTAYATGGLADFTGPAWLDGTPSKPEYVLNAQQTERFFSLVDVLEGLKIDGEPKKSSGDNYFDINISVEKIEDDYDVEQMADKIRRMIYDDATYRNVNAINHIR